MLKKQPKSLDSQFLIRIIRNEVSPEEKEFFDAWLSESDQNKEEFGNLVLLWDLAEQSKTSSLPDQEQQWEEIQKRIFDESLRHKQQISSHRNIIVSPKPNRIESQTYYKKDYTWLFRAAAIIVLSVGLTFLVKWNNDNKQQQKISFTGQTNPMYYELITQKGERKTFPLGDGTIVYLNSDSKLTYPKVFSDMLREVEISGEAFFSVMPDKERPFLVKSGKMITEVTGTEFNVRFRNKKVNVVVAKGSVKTFLDDSYNGIDLSKGQMISYSESKGFSSPVRVKLNHYLAWRNNKLSFERSPLKEVMDEIERYYNLEVVYNNDSVKDKVLTGVFDTDSLDQILSIISLTLDVTIDYKGSRVTIK